MRPEQIDPLYGGSGATPAQAVTAYETDIAERLVEQTAVAEGVLLSHYTQTQIDDFDTAHRVRVELAVKLLVVADLYGSAGQLNEKYEAEAARLLARAKALLQSLISADTGSDDGAHMVTITVGESFTDSDEDAW